MNVDQLLLKHGAHKSAEGYNLMCPYHLDKNPSLSVNTRKGVFICFGCGEKGTLRKLISKLTDGAVRIADKSIDVAPVQEIVSLPVDYVPLWGKVSSTFGKQALKYLHNRGVTNDQMRRFQLGYCGNGRYIGRIIAPVITNGKLLSFVARDFTGKSETKVKYPRGSRASEGLFGYDQMRKEGRLSRRVVLTEGWGDALAVDRVLPNKTGVLALGSNRISMTQLNLLENTPHIVVVLDSDNQGRLGSREVASLISVFATSVKVGFVSAGKDPGDCPPEALKKLLISLRCFS